MEPVTTIYQASAFNALVFSLRNLESRSLTVTPSLGALFKAVESADPRALELALTRVGKLPRIRVTPQVGAILMYYGAISVRRFVRQFSAEQLLEAIREWNIYWAPSERKERLQLALAKLLGPLPLPRYLALVSAETAGLPTAAACMFVQARIEARGTEVEDEVLELVHPSFYLVVPGCDCNGWLARRRTLRCSLTTRDGWPHCYCRVKEAAVA